MNTIQPRKAKKAEKKPSSNKKIFFAFLLFFLAFFGSFFIYLIMQVSLNSQTPMVVVISGSMEPAIKTGDLLFLKGVDDPSTIKNGTAVAKDGDVIVYNAQGLWVGAPVEPIVHRVIDKWYNTTTSSWYFLTKGDANPYADAAPVPASHILGVVVGGIPFVGWVKITLTDTGLFIPIIVILSALLIISIIIDIIKDEDESDDEKGKKKLEARKSGKKSKKSKASRSQELKESKIDKLDF